jgi:hypothetical protein
MKTRFGMLVALLALGMLCTIGTVAADNTTSTQGLQLANNIQPYRGPIGPDSSLYGLKLAFENLDDSFTFNRTDLLDKQVDQASLRLSELEAALDANQTGAANLALDQYWQKMNQTGQTLALFNETAYNGTYVNGTANWSGSMPVYNGNGYVPNGYLPANNGNGNIPVNTGNGYVPENTGTVNIPVENDNGYTPVDNGIGYTPAEINPALVHAQEMILSHQVLLESLMDSHPDNPGLARAYNNSQDIEQRFEQRTDVRFDRVQVSDHRVWFQPVRVIPVVQNRVIPVYSQGHTGQTVNRVVPASGNQSGGTGGHTWNVTSQPAGQTTQTWQDQHRTVTYVQPSHTPYPANGQNNENGNGSGNSNGDTNRNGNWDFRFRNP